MRAFRAAWLALAAYAGGAAAQAAEDPAKAPRWVTGPSWVEWGSPSARMRLGRDATPVARALAQGRLGGPEWPADNRPPGMVDEDDRLVQFLWAQRWAGLQWQGRLSTQSDPQPATPGLRRLVGLHLGLGSPGHSLHVAQQRVLQAGEWGLQRVLTARLSSGGWGLGLSAGEVMASSAPSTHAAHTAHLLLSRQSGPWRAFLALKRSRAAASDSSAPPWITEHGMALVWSANERDHLHWTLARPRGDGAGLHLGVALEHHL